MAIIDINSISKLIFLGGLLNFINLDHFASRNFSKMALTREKIERFKDAMRASLILRLVAGLQLVVGEVNFLSVLDASGSMQNLWSSFRGFLQTFGQVIQLVNINFRLMAVSDYDAGNPDKGIVKSAVPFWYTSLVVPHLNGLPRALRDQVTSAGHDLGRIMQILTEATANANSDDVQLTILMITSGLEVALANGTGSDLDESAVDRPKDYVFSMAPPGLNDILTYLHSFKMGTTIPGNGGDGEEAFTTAIVMAMAAALNADQSGETKLCFIVKTDTFPHLYNPNTREACAERDWLTSQGLPATFIEAVELAQVLGHHIIWCTNRDSPRFAADYFLPYPHMTYMSHPTMMTDKILSAMMLNAIVGMGMVGKPILPIQLTADQNADMSKRLKADGDHTATVAGLLTIYNIKTIVGGDHAVLTGLPTPSRDRTACTQILDSFLAIVKLDPALALFMWRLAPMIYKAKGACADHVWQNFQEFLTGLKTNPVLAAAIQSIFVSNKLANTEELEKLLTDVWTNCPVGNKMLVYTGEPLPMNALDDFGKFVTPEKMSAIIAAFKNFKVVDSFDVEATPLLDRNCLPMSVVMKPEYLNTVWALAMGNTTMPPQTMAFKLAVILLASATHVDIPSQLRFAAMNIVQQKYMKYLAFILDDRFKNDPEKNVLLSQSWWFQPIVLYQLIRVMETLRLQASLLNRVKFILAVRLAKARLEDKLVFNISQDDRAPVKAGRLWLCPSGKWMPETLCLPGDTCVYCEGTHQQLTEEGADNRFAGAKYHMDGTPEIQPTPYLKQLGIPDVCVDSDMKTCCSRCGCFYSVVDSPQTLADGSRRGRGENKPLCVGCRPPRSGAVTSYIRTCKTCGENWRFGTPSDDWQCVSCTHGDNLVRITTYKAQVGATVAQILSHNEGLRVMYAANYGLTPDVMQTLVNHHLQGNNLMTDEQFIDMFRLADDKLIPEQTFEPKYYMNIELPSGLKITHGVDWPFPGRTDADGRYTITNMTAQAALLCNIKTTRLRDTCSLGLCDAEDHPLADLISLCGECTFLTCKGCLGQMTRILPGTLTPVARLVCPCNRPISSEAMRLVGKPNHLATLRAGEAIEAGHNDHRIGICIGAMHEYKLRDVSVYRQTCRGQRVMAVPPHAGGCGAHNPQDDETEFRCPSCARTNDQYQIQLAEARLAEEHAHRARIETAFVETELDIDVLRTSLDRGTVIRRCPNCDMLTWHTGGCSHMTCAKCHVHWCWICRDYQTTGDACVNHLHRVHGGYMFDPALDDLDGGDDIIVATGPVAD